MVHAPQQHATACAPLNGSPECHPLIPLLELIPDSVPKTQVVRLPPGCAANTANSAVFAPIACDLTALPGREEEAGGERQLCR